MASLEEQIGGNVQAHRGGRSGQSLGNEVGELLGKPWSRQAVSDAERGRRVFTAAELIALAEALQTTVPQLFETDQPVTMPSGASIDPSGMDALMASTTSESERTARVLAEVRALTWATANLRNAHRILDRASARVSLAARGLPIKVVDSPLEGTFGDAVESIYAHIDDLLDAKAGVSQEGEDS